MSIVEKYGFVYIWYDRRHKRYYIGCHWGYEDDGYICSSSWMKKAYKIRPEDFKRRILRTNIIKREDMYVEEQRYFNMIKPEEIKPINDNPRYYNLNIKGTNPWHKNSDLLKSVGQKISASKKGKSTGPCSEEKAAKISEAKRESFRKRKEQTGSCYYEETSIKIKYASSNANKGKTHTEDHKQHMSNILKEQWANGERVSNGPLSEEHKQKISEGNKGKKLSEDQISLMRVNNSKTYTITFNDGREELISGLKLYATENNIPYVSLYKASQNKTSINKYNILSISLH